MDYSLLIGVKRERFEVLNTSLSSDPTSDGERDSRLTISSKNGRITDHALSGSVSAYSSAPYKPSIASSAAPSTPGTLLLFGDEVCVGRGCLIVIAVCVSVLQLKAQAPRCGS
jgi:hypothetical protein